VEGCTSLGASNLSCLNKGGISLPSAAVWLPLEAEYLLIVVIECPLIHKASRRHVDLNVDAADGDDSA
jgi:hypothetical protein